MIVALKTLPYDDGTSHVVLIPMEFMGRLSALVPKTGKLNKVSRGVSLLIASYVNLLVGR